MTGGLVAFLLAAFTHVSARSTVANRSFRIAVLEGAWFLGIFGFQIASKVGRTLIVLVEIKNLKTTFTAVL